MVKGLDKFEDYFRDLAENYILIGGAACDKLIGNAGLDFRATKDLDIILIVEVLSPEFVTRFWKFIEEGQYGHREKSSGEKKYYRFTDPKIEDFPFTRPSRFSKSCRACVDLICAGWQKPLPAAVCCKTGRFSRASRCSRAAQGGPSLRTDISARKGTSVRKPGNDSRRWATSNSTII